MSFALFSRRGRGRKPCRIAASTVAGCLLGSLVATAQEWKVGLPSDVTAEARSVAFVESAEGFRLSVRSASAGRAALCSVRLPDDIALALSVDRRIEVQVDANDPLSIMRWEVAEDALDDGDDFMEARRRISGVVPLVRLTADRVDFWCWRALKDQRSPASGLLRQILDGESLSLFVRASEDSEALETRFPLSGAPQAVSEALGISTQPSPRDRAQVELLAFRVNYRSKTCYLLAGKKGRKRCLQSVNRCARETHDSVLSMLECIEGR